LLSKRVLPDMLASMGWNKLRDESGTWRALAPRRAMKHLSREEKVVIKRAELPRWLKWAGLVALGGYFAGGIMNAAGAFSQRRAIITAALYVALLWIFMTLALGLVLLIRRCSGAHARSVGGAWLSLGRCAWCGYDLKSVAPAVGGTWTCPECGGRWSISAPTVGAEEAMVGT
jgi:hypothetical protein